MADRLTLTLFKGCSASELRDAIDQSALECGGKVFWKAGKGSPGVYLGLYHNDTTHSAIVYQEPASWFFDKVGGRLDIPWMELRGQEGSHWDYSLMKGSESLGAYSSYPQYWDDDPEFVKSHEGDPELLAKLWDVPLEKIDRYHLQWGEMLSESEFSLTVEKIHSEHVTVERNDLETLLKGARPKYARQGKAYPHDKHEYGDHWQMMDFLHALGGQDPRDEGDRHHIVLPEPKRPSPKLSWFQRLSRAWRRMTR
ncbi:hypothetical protein Pan216_45750 [Planctomycetes bacterium Pan216]|uniref:Uncharacterized protein n=1 Tax=Kolteria novifilia TaxID=2527975 RepID=A0A518B9N9_9BACT|nr:hypothetical protein Pan216_45750 [Planctomycetes bacterium Pan216]